MSIKLKAAFAAAAAAGALAVGGAGAAQASLHVGSEAAPLNQTGNMSITATAPSSRLVVNGLALNCSVTSGNAVIATGLRTTFPATIGTIQPVFGSSATPCIGPGGFEFTVSCVATSSLRVNSDVPISVGPPATWSGGITGISCTITFPTIGCSAVASGSVQGTYTNPQTPSTAGRLTVLAAGQTLAVSGSTCPAAVLPNGTAQYGGTGSTPTTVTNLVYTVQGALSGQPFLTRT